MSIVDEREPGQGGATFDKVLVGQTCLINGARWLKIANHNAPPPNILNLETLSTGNADASTPVADITGAELHLLPL